MNILKSFLETALGAITPKIVRNKPPAGWDVFDHGRKPGTWNDTKLVLTRKEPHDDDTQYVFLTCSGNIGSFWADYPENIGFIPVDVAEYLIAAHKEGI